MSFNKSSESNLHAIMPIADCQSSDSLQSQHQPSYSLSSVSSKKNIVLSEEGTNPINFLLPTTQKQSTIYNNLTKTSNNIYPSLQQQFINKHSLLNKECYVIPGLRNNDILPKSLAPIYHQLEPQTKSTNLNENNNKRLNKRYHSEQKQSKCDGLLYKEKFLNNYNFF